MVEPVAGSTGGARPTMGDVARAAGVSTALVSIVMRGVPGASEATRRRVLDIADEMGYVPDRRAQKLRQASSRLLGVVFELQQPFHGDVVEQIYAAATRRGYDVMLSAVAPSRAEKVAVQALLRERCEAAILLGTRFDSDELGALADRVPALVVARASGLPGVGAVRGDDVAGITLAVDHLTELGHRNIAHIDGADAPGGADRRAGFLAAMHRHGLSASATVVAGGTTETEGAQGMHKLLEMATPPTAVVAFNDRCATGVLDLLVRRGRDVPADISVMGYDDSRLARIPHVQMTTISQDATHMAEAAVDGALAQIAGDKAVDLVLAPHLVRRATTGPVAHRD
ncbi:LacI family DNA-binding transcriptional regulator [Rhodococcus opacus]|uniref:LacI family DNA-binding transcriptional regulator n=1 Tax=Rhodococcus opacus TaxID=37919 RepID=UPI0024741356|nr:LacI family DNA-binding transcriptional regulator [Rhodococcus opacus]MDH6287711.1 DNA-binding LacI/PurR family transcriptional regulator [Rhodococcus opacus]